MSLYNSGIDDQLIIERMDHRSNAVREYKRPPTGNSFDPHMKCNDAEQIVRQHAWFLFITFSNWFALLLKKNQLLENLYLGMELILLGMNYRMYMLIWKIRVAPSPSPVVIIVHYLTNLKYKSRMTQFAYNGLWMNN